MKPTKKAQFHDALRYTLEGLAKDGLVSQEEVADCADRSDEGIALLLLARTYSVIQDLQQKVAAAADMMREADKTLELIIQEQADEKLETAA